MAQPWAVSRRSAGFGGASESGAVRQPDEAVRSAPSRLGGELLSALETAAANIEVVAEAQLAEASEVRLEQGQSVAVREVPVVSAGIYAPGGTAAYPSTVLMG